MKKMITILAIGAFAFSGKAQETTPQSGVVTYQTSRQFEMKIQGDQEGGIASMMPKERKSKKELLFNGDKSLYRNAVNDDAESEVVSESAGAAHFTIKMVEPEDFIFMDAGTHLKIEQREFMSRRFLITTATDTVKWKLTGNRRQILGYDCLEASLTGADKKTLVWFAPTIQVEAGPDGFIGLPGLILGVDIDEGKNTITATNIDFKEVDPKEIKAPRKGKKVSRKEFDNIVAEKNAEMNASGGGMVIIKTEK